MCTVTIIPVGKDDFVLTSNRDEAPNRISLNPKIYNESNASLLYPKDQAAGGTWVGVSSQNRVVCLLNGAFEKHTRLEQYRHSRGVVVKDILLASSIDHALESYNLQDVEPFTLVIVDWNKSLRFFELVWDGSTKHITELPIAPKIWSSSTLYSSDMRLERLNWFNAYKAHNTLDDVSVLNFHKTAGKPNLNYGTVMDRGHVKTTSITQISKTSDTINMRFESLVDGAVTNDVFKIAQVINE